MASWQVAGGPKGGHLHSVCVWISAPFLRYSGLGVAIEHTSIFSDEKQYFQCVSIESEHQTMWRGHHYEAIVMVLGIDLLGGTGAFFTASWDIGLIPAIPKYPGAAV